jgi:translocation and assembly module TamA
MYFYLVALIKAKRYLLFLIFIDIFFFSSVVYADSVNKQSESTAQQAHVDKKKIVDNEKSEKLKVEVIITGIDGELRDNALAYLDLRKSMNDKHFSIGWLKKLHKVASRNIQKSLQPFGYYNVSVTSTLKEKEDKSWLAHYVVTAGKQVKITELNIVVTGQGKDDPEIKALINNFPIKIGDPLNHAKYEDAKSDITIKIGRIGYSQVATHTKRVIVNPKNNSAKLNIEFISGTKFYLGKIIFHQDMLNEDFILSYLKNIKESDPLAHDKLVELQHTLSSSGYFSSVDVKPNFEMVNDDHVPVDITLEPSNRHKFSFGAGYDTEIQANVSARWNYRRINHYGHYADVVSKLSTKKSNIRGSYWIPAGDPRTDKYGLITNLEIEDTDTTERSTLDMELGYWFEMKVEDENKRGTNNWENTIFSEYKLENFTVGNSDNTTTQVFSLGARTQRVNVEDKLFPRKGWSLFSEVRGSAFISDVNYLRLYLKSRLYLPVAEKGRIVLRGELGMAETSDFGLYPSSLRFYAGGDQSVRGYKWKELGPKDEDGNVIGGRNVFTSSFEYDHQISDSWVAAGFIDAGNAYNDTYDTIYYGAGFGARYISPIGLIKGDIGFPLKTDGNIGKDNFVFYFGFEINL